MDEFTIISYPGSNTSSLLSLTESRSSYMLPFGGRFRVVDFTIRNSFSSSARQTIIYSNIDDGLESYINNYGPFDDEPFPRIKTIIKDYSDINIVYNLIMDSNSQYYLIYNGDIPTIINFNDIIKKFKKKKSDALLFRLNIDGKPSMAYKVLAIKQKTLLKIVNKALKNKVESPNIFEMVMNILINKGIAKSSFDAYYWSAKNIPEYYQQHWDIIWNPEIFDMLFKEKIIKSQILDEGFAQIGPSGKVAHSFISDYCYINGKVENSIIYPGVHIEKDSHIQDSIILPYVKIGQGVKITRSVIDERTDLNPLHNYYNIEAACRIGTPQEYIKNNDFPQTLFSSITLIGRDNRIPYDTRIGGGCFVNSKKGEAYFSKVKFLYDGVSLL